jgi:asparagine synthase (glutamine-hydrolysing)
VFGDEVFIQVPRLVRLRRVLARQTPFELRDVARLGYFVAPPPIRRAVAARRFIDESQLPAWLSPAFREAALRQLATDVAIRPLRFDRELHWWWGQRMTQLSSASLKIMAAQNGASISAPFGDPLVLATLARWRSPTIVENRQELLRLLFQDLLPDQVLSRRSKATFSGVFWNRHTRAFAREWSGAGLDPSLVDPELLRSTWEWEPTGPHAIPANSFQSAAPLQAAWLHQQGRPTPLSPR